MPRHEQGMQYVTGELRTPLLAYHALNGCLSTLNDAVILQPILSCLMK